MQEKRTEIVKFQGVVTTTPAHRQLVRTNGMLMGAIFFLMLMIFLIGVLFAPNSDLISNYKKIYQTETSFQELMPVASPKVNHLDGQLIGLVSGSIESKLNALELSIKSGATTSSLDTIEDLKNDIKVLRSYSESPKNHKIAVSNEELAEEMTHLKGLIYMSLTSCGIMFAAAAGTWVKYRKRLPPKENQTGFLGKN